MTIQTNRDERVLSAGRRVAIFISLAVGVFFAFRATMPPVSATSSAAPVAEIAELPPAADSVSPFPVPVTQSIKDIRLGQRVVGTNPLREQTQKPSDIRPDTWRSVRLRMVQHDVEYDLAFLRPLSWIEATEAAPGRSIPLQMEEMGLDGPAEVVAIDPCPAVEPDDGTGRMVVTGTMSHPAPNILHIDITGQDESLGVTTTHPMWSEDRQDFVLASDLRIGEHLRTLTGESAQVTRITPHRGPPEMVYNLEVDAEHVYCVGHNGMLVHNNCPFAMGLANRLRDFATTHGATTFRHFADQSNWKPQVLNKLRDPNTRVLFNLDGVNVWQGIARAASGQGGPTDWELLQIYQNNFPNIQFFLNGVEVANPFN